MKIILFNKKDNIVFETIGGYTPKLDSNLSAILKTNVIDAGDLPFDTSGITVGGEYTMWLQGKKEDKGSEYQIKIESIKEDQIVIQLL